MPRITNSAAGGSGGGLLAPQVSVVDGQIVINQATLTVQAQPEDLQRRIVEDDQKLNSRTYAVNRNPSDRWQESETNNFFRVCTKFVLLGDLQRSETPISCALLSCTSHISSQPGDLA